MQRLCGLLLLSRIRLSVAALQSGDLIFLRPPVDESSNLSRAILATGEATLSWLRARGSSPNVTAQTASHVALAWHNGTALNFVQALPPAVVVTPAAEFWHSAPPGTRFFRAWAVDPALRALGATAAQLAASLVGAPYAEDFGPPSTGRFYCSSLAEYAFELATRQASEVLVPADFELLWSPPSFWRRYFAHRGRAVPENVTGSNPTLLLQSVALRFEEIGSASPPYPPAPPPTPLQPLDFPPLRGQLHGQLKYLTAYGL